MRAKRSGQGLVTVAPWGASRPIAFTPVVTWPGNTITTQSGFYVKVPGELHVWVSFVETAGTASAVLTITIPPGYTAVTMAGSLSVCVGQICSTNVGVIPLFAAAGATTSIATPVTNGSVATWSGTFIIPTLT